MWEAFYEGDYALVANGVASDVDGLYMAHVAGYKFAAEAGDLVVSDLEILYILK